MRMMIVLIIELIKKNNIKNVDSNDADNIAHT